MADAFELTPTLEDGVPVVPAVQRLGRLLFEGMQPTDLPRGPAPSPELPFFDPNQMQLAFEEQSLVGW
jgi:hypothetical protein